MTSPRVVAVVLNWCNAPDTLECVASLRAQDHPVEILLVDNASPDGSGDVIHRACADLAYIQTASNLGYSGGNNAGIAWARDRGAEFVLVVNNDTVAEPGMVRALLDAAKRHPRGGAFSPWIGLHSAPTVAWYAGGRFDRLRALGVHEQFSDERGCTFASGCCLLLRGSMLDAIGLFDASFGSYVEDAELSLRSTRAGWELWFVPSARLLHKTVPVTAEPSAAQIRLRDRNRRRLVAIHYGVVDRLAFSLWFYPTRVVHLARYLVRGDSVRARAVVQGALGA